MHFFQTPAPATETEIYHRQHNLTSRSRNAPDPARIPPDGAASFDLTVIVGPIYLIRSVLRRALC